MPGNSQSIRRSAEGEKAKGVCPRRAEVPGSQVTVVLGRGTDRQHTPTALQVCQGAAGPSPPHSLRRHPCRAAQPPWEVSASASPGDGSCSTGKQTEAVPLHTHPPSPTQGSGERGQSLGKPRMGMQPHEYGGGSQEEARRLPNHPPLSQGPGRCPSPCPKLLPDTKWTQLTCASFPFPCPPPAGAVRGQAGGGQA